MAKTKVAPLPDSKDAFSFSEQTREYLGVVRVFLSPIESTYFLPNNVVELAPPVDVGLNQTARLNVSGDAWEIVPDFRRIMLYSTSTAWPVPNTLALGEVPPNGVTAMAPVIGDDSLPIRNAWDTSAGVWREEPDYSRHPVYEKATANPAPKLEPGMALPESLTTIVPPEHGADTAPRWNEASATWELVADYRGVVYWTPDGQEHKVTELGAVPPVDALSEPPPPLTPEDAEADPDA